MSKINDLLAQIAALENQVAEVRKSDIREAITKVNALIEEFGLTPADIFPSRKAKIADRKTGKVAAKYKDPVSGKTWSGRGLTPKWLVGKSKADYLVK
jgi:DNA-binding protein H-NS